MMWAYALAALGGYLLGSIPFGLVLTRLAGLGDIRKIGSGNIGATNVLRTGRKDLALATLLLDAGKAGIALLLARAVWGSQPYWAEVSYVAGGMAFLGHCYPVWLGFKGGKGVATFFGLLFAGLWPIAVVAGATWLAAAAIFRYSSLAALAAAAVAPLFAFAGGAPDTSGVIFCLVLSVLIFWRHRANIQRLLNGTEPKIGQKAAAPAAAAPVEQPPAPPASEPPAATG
ncbi:MAG TPA: glycerol-3-phosphate 1-O-acyltransferase PlsY [Caulobacterales bacterium]|nr:glycerol-3-phosphate 1-O-acyltransferase PlsY [Caulobacterales bacterium]